MAVKCPKCQTENPETSLFCSDCGTKLEAAKEFSLLQAEMLRASLQELNTGSTFANRYQIVEKLGEGGMGVVYKALDTRLDRFVAIKILPPEKISDPERKLRFIQEAKAASALNHPNIIHVYDIDQTEGIGFIAMEYVDGRTLDEVIGRRGLKLGEALNYAIQVADSLASAHEAGIVHRDLKPGNVMVTEKGQVKVLDFGLAKLTEALPVGEGNATRTLKPVTEEGRILGTVAYMSPEQAEGKKVDARSDIFSFGSLLYEMVTGKRAFQGESSASTLAAILKENPKPASELVADLPREVERLVSRCLRKEVDKRFQHMDDVKIGLEEIKEESDSGALAAVSPSRKERHSHVWLPISIAACALLAILGWLFFRNGRKHAPPLMAAPLTSFAGSATSPSFSPDGNEVTFSWNGEKADNYDIYIKLIGSPAKPLRLTTDPAWDGSPAFSPDGRSIVFIRIAGDRVSIILISAIGGTEQTLAELQNASNFLLSRDIEWLGQPGPMLAWSPDGKWIATSGLALLSIESGELHGLTSLPTTSFQDYHPAFSPDGRSIAFSRSGGGNMELYILEITEDFKPKGEARRLTFLSRTSNSPVWTADGREIIFASSTLYQPALWRMAASGSGVPTQLFSTGGEDTWPAISRQGNRLAFVRKVIDLNIWRFSRAGSSEEYGSPARFLYSSRGELNPQFSPDGRKLVFESDRTGVHGIWVSDADGSNLVEVFSKAGSSAGTPRWAPDSQHISFDSNAGGQFAVYTMRASAGKPVCITPGSSGDLISSWSSDGLWIYFCSMRSGQAQIWKAPAKGGEAIQVTRNGGIVSFESRDGKYLYFTKGWTADSSLWKMPVAGGEESQVLQSVSLRNFVVMDDGIYFIPRPDAEGNTSLKFLSFATNTIKTIAPLPSGGLASLAIGLTVSPDRQSILFSRNDVIRCDLMLVENFR